MHGELIPIGGGDPIPLLKKDLLVGRRESCDIVLRFSNVSAHHCRLICNGGYWYVKDLQSRNGIKVNGSRVADTEKLLEPGDELVVAKHRYEVRYSPHDLGAVGPPPVDNQSADLMKKSLLERAGLETKGSRQNMPPVRSKESNTGRFDILDDSEGQIKDPNRPV